MKSAIKYITVWAILAFTLPSYGSAPPSQLTIGPGGSNYKYASVSISGPFNDGGACPGPACNHGIDYYIFQPAVPRPAKPLPIILFLHGYSADDPSAYQAWIEHIARKGFTVIWVNWDNNATAGGDTVINNEVTALQDAITRLKGDQSYVQPAVDNKDVIRAAIVGHSAGAFTGFRVAALSWDPTNNIPPIRAVAAINPGQGNLPDYDMSQIASSTLASVVVGSDETTCEQYAGAKLYDQLPMIPASAKVFLEARTDNHGSPGVSAVHNFPATLAPMFPLDDLDWNVSYKISVALFDCAFYNLNCLAAPANATAQIDMGKWSDNVPVLPMIKLTADPELTFPWPTGVGCTR